MEYNKRIASVTDFCRYYLDSAFSLSRFASARDKLLDSKFIERIMLSVTEVNGCKVCSQGHTKMALESGMSSEEIHSLLSNVQSDVPVDESVAIMYAAHYADTSGRPDTKATERLFDTYGTEKAKAIIGAIRMIMVGNTLGIAYGTFTDRLHGKGDSGSSIPRELAMVISAIVLLPVYLVVALAGALFS